MSARIEPSTDDRTSKPSGCLKTAIGPCSAIVVWLVEQMRPGLHLTYVRAMISPVCAFHRTASAFPCPPLTIRVPS